MKGVNIKIYGFVCVRENETEQRKKEREQVEEMK